MPLFHSRHGLNVVYFIHGPNRPSRFIFPKTHVSAEFPSICTAIPLSMGKPCGHSSYMQRILGRTLHRHHSTTSKPKLNTCRDSALEAEIEAWVRCGEGMFPTQHFVRVVRVVAGSYSTRKKSNLFLSGEGIKE